MKATRMPGAPKDIEVSASRQGGRAVILVRDRGRGIPGDMAEKVFDPFFTDKVHGSGVGLPLARRFVEGAGGALTLVPADGGGTEARIALRLQGARMRVLIADDEKNIRESIAAYLASEGIETATAADGAQARARLEDEAFDGLVLDLRMPKLDGLAVLAWLQEEGPPVPVIVISAYGDVRDAVQAMKLGARDYLVKPFDPEELVMRLRRAARRKAPWQARWKPEAGRRREQEPAAGSATRRR